MIRLLAAGFVAMLGLAASATAAEPPADSRGLLERINPFATSAPPAGPRLRPAVPPLTSESLLAVLQTEKDAYARRLEACQKLRVLAHDLNDDKLDLQANALERQATETYRLRVGKLGISSPMASPMKSPVDELERRLGAGSGAALTAKKIDPKQAATARAGTFKEVAP